MKFVLNFAPMPQSSHHVGVQMPRSQKEMQTLAVPSASGKQHWLSYLTAAVTQHGGQKPLRKGRDVFGQWFQSGESPQWQGSYDQSRKLSNYIFNHKHKAKESKLEVG